MTTTPDQPDHELDVMWTVTDALGSLDPKARARVLDYVTNRFCGEHRTHSSPARRRMMTEDRLASAAAQFQAGGTEAVMTGQGLGERQARRLVSTARAAGLLQT